MTLEEKAKQYAIDTYELIEEGQYSDERARIQGYLAGAKENGLQWHKIFIDSEPNPCEYYELPQEALPKNENFYFVKLKNGFIKICELKYDCWSKKKYFYDLHGVTQSNVAEWLEYPTV